MNHNPVISVAVAENRRRKVVNQYGKIAEYNNGGFRVGMITPRCQGILINRQAEFSREAEAWGILRAVEFAIGTGMERVIIACAGLASWTAERHRAGQKPSKTQYFLDLALAKAEVANLGVEFSSDPDKAAALLARDQGAPFLPRVEEKLDASCVKAMLRAIQTDRHDAIIERREARFRVEPTVSLNLNIPAPNPGEVDPELVDDDE